MENLTLYKVINEEEKLSERERLIMIKALSAFSFLAFPQNQDIEKVALAEKYVKLGYLLANVSES